MKLTVAIPTYNRNNILIENIKHLLPQLKEDCELLIIDNASDVPIELTLNSLLSTYTVFKKRVIRNKYNIGGSANVLRCFELCETEWLWCLGDDDLIVENAVELIRTTLIKHPEAIFLNYTVPNIIRKKTIINNTLKEFIESIDHYGTLLCISASIFNFRALIKHLKIGYQYAYSNAPHIAILLSELVNGGKTVLMDKQLISIIRTHGFVGFWSLIDVSLCMFTLLRLPGLNNNTWLLSKHIASLVAFDAVVFQLITLRLNGVKKSEVLYLFDSYMFFIKRSNKTLLLCIKKHVYRFLLLFPSLGNYIFNLAFKIMGKNRPEYGDCHRT
jgi:glycosyltransferase involved in cell wall biosynthesis